jgi:predicted Zn-dependent protease with MMP-like domain
VKKGERLSAELFHQLAEAELASIPKPLRALLINVTIETRAAPGLEAEELDAPQDVLGLYWGATRHEMLGNDAHGFLPAKVYLYQRNLEDTSADLDELKKELRLTLRHELAHYFGFEDADLERVWPEGA